MIVLIAVGEEVEEDAVVPAQVHSDGTMSVSGRPDTGRGEAP